MFSDNQSRRRLAMAAALALMVLASGCSASTAPDLESLGLAIETDIQAGATFEVAAPKQPGTTVSVKTTPAGITAAITDAPTDGMMLLMVNVEFDTPRGDYNLGLSVIRDGEEFVVGWPFEVVEPGGPTPTTVPVATTQPTTSEAVLAVESPQPGDLLVSSDIVKGFTSTEQVGYRLSAGGAVLDEGTLTTVDGYFESPIVFTNTCCIEMLLEVFHLDAEGMTVTIPLSYPEGDASVDDAATLLISFGAAWEAADWAAMRTLAADPVVAEAQGWFIEGGEVGVAADTIETVLDNGWFLYVPPEGYALIFNFAYDATESGLVLTELTFGGDAG
jgi:hypothetical protein